MTDDAADTTDLAAERCLPVLNPPSDLLGDVGLLCRVLPSGTHAGIVYRAVSGIRMLHLAGHCILRDDPHRFAKSACVAAPAFPRERQLMVAAMCQLIAECHPQVPYSLRHSRTTGFSLQTGELKLGPGQTGLTCATFVAAVFESVGLPLVDIDDWVVREGDVQRQHELVKVLRIADAPASHIALVEKEIGSVRVRPEEVAGSALVKTPCSMRSAEFAASHILRVAAG